MNRRTKMVTQPEHDLQEQLYELRKAVHRVWSIRTLQDDTYMLLSRQEQRWKRSVTLYRYGGLLEYACMAVTTPIAAADLINEMCHYYVLSANYRNDVASGTMWHIHATLWHCYRALEHNPTLLQDALQAGSVAVEQWSRLGDILHGRKRGVYKRAVSYDYGRISIAED